MTTRQFTSKMPKNSVGFLNMMQFSLSFLEWANSRRTAITWEMIRDDWQVHRATAYRWLAAWNAFQEMRAANHTPRRAA